MVAASPLALIEKIHLHTFPQRKNVNHLEFQDKSTITIGNKKIG